MKNWFEAVHFHDLLSAAVLAFSAFALVPSAANAADNAAAKVNNSADPNKVLRMAFPAGDNGFDLARTVNVYSHWVGEAIFQRLLTYDYLASPARLSPQAALEIPSAEDGGKTYTFRLKKGIYFAPDAAFNGVRREMTAHDFAYAIKRTQDPELRSPIGGFLDGKLLGMDELVAKAKKSGKFDYDAPVAGIEVPDPYTLRLKLKEQDYNFLFIMAYPGFGAVAREVVQKYGMQSGLHPVGSGPYMLQSYVPGNKIVLVANPEFKEFTWDFSSSGNPLDQQIIAEMKGKKMPQIGRIEIQIMEEEQPRWLAFQDKQLDMDLLPQTVAPTVLDGAKLKPSYTQQGIRLVRYVDPEVIYTLFNFRDPYIGGYSKEKIALRRAIAMVYSIDDEIEKVRMGQAVRAEMMIPPGVLGNNPAYRSSIPYDINLANKLLDRFGYKRGADGFRTMPDGKPLIINIRGQTSSVDKNYAEIWKRGLDKIGLKGNFTFSSFADNMKEANECKLAMWGSAWTPDIPDGENFLQNLYGPNAMRGNHGCYESAAYDALYKKAIAMPHGPERYKLYEQMNRQMEADTAWSLHVSRVRNWVVRPWVKGFKKHPILQANWELMDVEKH